MLNNINWAKFINNTLIFLRPVLFIYLGYLSTTVSDGLQWSDLVPSAFISGSMSLYMVNVITDFLRKLEEQRDKKITEAIADKVEADENEMGPDA